MKRLKSLILLGSVILSIMATSLIGSAVQAAQSESATASKIVLSTQDNSENETQVLTAHLTNNDTPIANQPVVFYVDSDFFGNRPVKLDTVTSDAAGYATLDYQPKWEGTHIITAQSVENPDIKDTITISYNGLVSRYSAPPIGLEQIRGIAPKVVPIIVIVVWALLGFIALGTARGITRARRHASKAQDIYVPQEVAARR